MMACNPAQILAGTALRLVCGPTALFRRLLASEWGKRFLPSQATAKRRAIPNRRALPKELLTFPKWLALRLPAPGQGHDSLETGAPEACALGRALEA
jgi:hypothetical protein